MSTAWPAQRSVHQPHVRTDHGHIRFFFPGKPLSANDRPGIHAKNEWTQVHKTEAMLTARTGLRIGNIVKLEKPVVIFHRRWTSSNPSKIDASNIHPAAKAIVDGLVEAELLLEDHGLYVPLEAFLAPRKKAPCNAIITTIVPYDLYLANPDLTLSLAMTAKTESTHTYRPVYVDLVEGDAWHPHDQVLTNGGWGQVNAEEITANPIVDLIDVAERGARREVHLQALETTGFTGWNTK
jgi:hypothetical protein